MYKRGHTRKTFESKSKKRALHAETAAEIHSQKAVGHVVSLTGPCVREHFRNCKKLLGSRCQFYVAESNLKTLTKGKMINQVTSLQSKKERIQLFPGDVFDLLKQITIGKRSAHKLLLLDLDFCDTAEKIEKGGLLKHLRKLIKSGKLRQSGFFLEITFCLRNRTPLDIEKLIPKIYMEFVKAGWHWEILRSKDYKDGAPMRYTSFKFHLPSRRKERS